jgi:hypothetical protein
MLVGVVWGSVLLAMPAWGQTPTGSIAGRVSDPSGAAMPGVTVTATSPYLQGARVVVTVQNGDYVIALLPPGDYEVGFEIEGFQAVTRAVGVSLTQTVTLNETLALSGVEEEVTVLGRAGAFAQTAQVATKFRQDLITTLPSNRSLDASLLMFPGVHPTGPSGGYSINGAASFESVFTINGVSVTENLRGQPLHLYIEDALQETTVVSSGLSAEYGRFGGGLVNAITKSGGNEFSGSYRLSLANDSWRSKTPFVNDTMLDTTIPTHEYTFGGPLAHDQLWFFNAGRFQAQENALTTAAPTAIPYTRTNDEQRYEGKLTYSPAGGHTVTGSYLRVDQELGNYTQFNVLDLASLGHQTQDSKLWAIRYAGILSPSWFGEVQYSARRGALTAAGGLSSDLIFGTPIVTPSGGPRFWSPAFCGSCGADNRDNNDILVKTTYFRPTNRRGSHTFVAGYDRFVDHRQTNNFQSGSNFRIQVPAFIVEDTTVYPIFAGPTFIIATPISLASTGTDLVTHSLFLNDDWRYNERVSINLGIRFDRNHGEDAAGGAVSNDRRFSPRLGIVVDPTGEGRWAVSASLARYVTSLNTSISDVSPAGNPDTTVWQYVGPPINADSTQPRVGTAEALQRLFDWFAANGGESRPTIFRGLASVSRRIGGSLASPNADEFALGLERQIARGSVRADFVYRRFNDFYGARTDLSTGRVFDGAGAPFDLTLIENTDVAERQYRAVSVQATRRIGRALDLGGNYTVSRAWGNFDGETSNSGPVPTPLLSYPEYQQASWFSPVGDLSVDQRHRLRIWGVYEIPVADAVGSLNVAVSHQYGSGVPYGAVGVVSTVPYVVNPGYVQPSGNNSNGWDYYFTDRDAFRTEGTNRTDLALNYGYQIGGGRLAELFLHVEVLNLFNRFQLCGCGDNVFRNGGNVNLNKVDRRTLSPGQNGMQAFNPLTTTPVEGVNWSTVPTFGTAVDRFAYTTPRTFRFSFGVRF